MFYVPCRYLPCFLGYVLTYKTSELERKGGNNLFKHFPSDRNDDIIASYYIKNQETMKCKVVKINYNICDVSMFGIIRYINLYNNCKNIQCSE